MFTISNDADDQFQWQATCSAVDWRQVKRRQSTRFLQVDNDTEIQPTKLNTVW